MNLVRFSLGLALVFFCVSQAERVLYLEGLPPAATFLHDGWISVLQGVFVALMVELYGRHRGRGKHRNPKHLNGGDGRA